MEMQIEETKYSNNYSICINFTKAVYFFCIRSSFFHASTSWYNEGEKREGKKVRVNKLRQINYGK